ncbi:MAG TPA: alanine racemase [Candidatus Acidoferrum sp.]|nr:alanine racemase [Candidatus Acidoferrum sp.]
MSHRVTATIDRSALAHNLAVARRYSPHSKIVALIKADAYGHGLIGCAEALKDADVFGVTDVEEAEKLRRAGVHKDILVLQGILDRSDIRRAAHHGLQLVVHRTDDLTLLEQELAHSHLRHKLTLWLKIDTGMGRLGLPPAEVQRVHLALKRQPWVQDVVLMTHLANASLPESPLNDHQLLQFARSCQPLAEFAPQTSIAASAAILALDAQADYARPGIMLYGSSPFAWRDADRRRDAFGLRNVMTLQARLIHVQQHQAGDNIGYNSQFICPAAMRIGIVAAGYADGYPSQTPNGCPVLVGKQRTMTVGRVSMDMLAIDLTHCVEAKVGDLATLWGDDLCIDEVAAHIGVISYQLTTGLSQRVTRHYR